MTLKLGSDGSYAVLLDMVSMFYVQFFLLDYQIQLIMAVSLK